MRHVLLLALTCWSLSAFAGTPRYHPHTLAPATAACPTGSPGLAPDGIEWGISLSGLRGFKVTVCPATVGQTLTGAGSLLFCVFSTAPWGPGQWALSPEFTKSFSGKTSTVANPCVELGNVETVVGLSDRVFAYPSSDFGVSSGNVTVYLVGEAR